MHKLIIPLLWLAHSCQAQPNEIYLSRHMEKAPAGRDPALTECGQAQAAALASLLRTKAPSVVYHTPYQRTRQTAQALRPTPLRAYDPTDLPALQSSLVQQSGVVVVIGHSNTIPALAQQLSGQPVAALTEQDYGLVYQLNRRNDSWHLSTWSLPAPAACQSAAPL